MALSSTPPPMRRKPLEHDAVDAVGADGGRGRSFPLRRPRRGRGSRPGSRPSSRRLRAEGKDGITVIRAMLRRMTMLARLRAEVERGRSVGAVMASAGKAIFYKEQARSKPSSAVGAADLGQGDLRG